MEYYGLRQAGDDIDLVISLDRLLFLKTLAIRAQDKYYRDVLLLVDEILKRKYSA